MRTILLHMFDRPRGVLGRWGGIIMARMNEDCGFWVADLLEIGLEGGVLESVLAGKPLQSRRISLTSAFRVGD